MSNQAPKPRPAAATRTSGAHAIAYRAAMVVAMLDELHLARRPGLGLPVHQQNAFLQSSLVDLRSLIGFLLADADDFVPGKNGSYHGLRIFPTDVRPSWYTVNGEPWHPRTTRRRRALYSFYDPVGTHLAHIAIKSRSHPGEWPIVEAAVVVGQDLSGFLDQLRRDIPAEAERFDDYDLPLTTTLGVLLHRPYAAPYSTGRAEPGVARARRLLRTQLGWHDTN